jgi:hypothetical protein
MFGTFQHTNVVELAPKVAADGRVKLSPILPTQSRRQFATPLSLSLYVI